MSRQHDPAFPTPHFVNPNGDIQWGAPGLTLREHFAAMAMQGTAADTEYSVAYIRDVLAIPPDDRYVPEKDWPRFVAKRAVVMADALISELAKAVTP